MKEEIKTVININKDNLNIYQNEKRLIFLALIKTKGNLRKAYKLNDPKYLSFEGYSKKFYRYGISITHFKAF